MVATILAFQAAYAAEAVIVEAGWRLSRSVPLPRSGGFSGVGGIVYNPIDDAVYFADQGSRLAKLSRGSGEFVDVGPVSGTGDIAVNDANGDMFISTGTRAEIRRVPFGSASSETWVTRFRSSDADPVGLDIAPPGYSGLLDLAPGQGLVADRGVLGSVNGIFKFSAVEPEGATLLSQALNLFSPDDVTITQSRVFVADAGRTNSGFEPGAVYELTVFSNQNLVQVVGFPSVLHPQSITADPLTGDILVLDFGLLRLLRIDPAARTTSTVVDFGAGGRSLGFAPSMVDFAPDGSAFYVYDRDENGAPFVNEFVRTALEGRAVPMPFHGTALSAFILIVLGVSALRQRKPS